MDNFLSNPLRPLEFVEYFSRKLQNSDAHAQVRSLIRNIDNNLPMIILLRSMYNMSIQNKSPWRSLRTHKQMPMSVKDFLRTLPCLQDRTPPCPCTRPNSLRIDLIFTSQSSNYELVHPSIHYLPPSLPPPYHHYHHHFQAQPPSYPYNFRYPQITPPLPLGNAHLPKLKPS